MVVFVVPSHATREVARLARPHVGKDALLVSATKGIEIDSLMLMSEVLEAELPDAPGRQARVPERPELRERGRRRGTRPWSSSPAATRPTVTP